MTKDDSEYQALSRQSLKAAVWYTVAKIAENEETDGLPIAVSEHFVASLAEVVFAQALSLGKDLERFAKHANRTTITVDDVKLASRRNDALYELIVAEATKNGLALADSKSSKPAAAPRPRAKPKVKAAATTTSKGKGKAKAGSSKMEVDDEDDSDSNDSEEVQLAPVKKRRAPAKKAAAD